MFYESMRKTYLGSPQDPKGMLPRILKVDPEMILEEVHGIPERDTREKHRKSIRKCSGFVWCFFILVATSLKKEIR